MFQKILCPTDFSADSYEALKVAVALAKDGRAEVCVLHVGQSMPRVATVNTTEEAENLADAVMKLCEVLDTYIPPAVRARPLLKFGGPAAEILRMAKEEKADLIVLTAWGEGSAQGGTLGRVASEILQLSPCPVLVLGTPRGESRERVTVAPAMLGTEP